MKNKLQLLGAMSIFGTVGIFVKFIPLQSATIAFVRGVLGVLFLVLVMALGKKKPAWSAIRKNLLILLFSGAAIGINWVLLFESYRYPSVAISTVCYYLAPLFLLLMSPLLGERLTKKKLTCIGFAFLGMVLLTGVEDSSAFSFAHLRGILLATGAAVFYATVMLLNKKLSPIPAYDKTIFQLGAASLVIVPYLFYGNGFTFTGMDLTGWVCLGILGVIHTGFAYALYFGAIKHLPTHTIALFSYLDPVLAVILSAVLLREPLSIWGVLGTILILGSALYSELPGKKKR